MKTHDEFPIFVLPLGRLAKLADVALVPIMYLVSMSFVDAPQRTHFWNNTKLGPYDVVYLTQEMVVFLRAVKARKPWLAKFIPLFHMPIIGGWKQYVVLKPVHYNEEPFEGDWYIGWSTLDLIGVSRIPNKGPVRLLRGPAPVCFFAIDMDGKQLKLKKDGEGTIGKRCEFSRLPLL